jgi:pyridoxine 5-phosphate synthase
MPRLGVNIDHVATIRQARQASEPDPVFAAEIAESAGADSITVHLREDRRHINDRDVKILRQMVKSRLNLEMSIAPSIVNIACRIKPDQATLVPEKRQEITTEGGLNIIIQERKIKNVIQKLKIKGILVSVFIEADMEQIKAAKRVKADAIELHTGTYANARTQKNVDRQLSNLSHAAEFAKSLGLHVYAGHGLNYQNVVKLLKQIPDIEELNIGHSIVSRAVLTGMDEAVRSMKILIEKK